jgi:hypothetical protein
VNITYLPHAEEQMRKREIPEDEARAALERPDREYPGNLGRMIAERVFEGRRLAVKVVYNVGSDGGRVVVTVMRSRPKV